MAAAAAAHVQFVCHQQATQVDAAAANTFAEVAAAYTVDAIMESVLVHRTHDVAELMATVVALPDLLATRVDIRTVIIDSVAFPLRGAVPISAGEAAAHYGGGASGSGAGWEAHARRTRLAMSISRKLHGVAENYNVAVIATNHMTPSAASFGSDAPTTYTSTLGDEWSHSIARRVLLSAKASHTMRTASVTSNAQVREAFLLKWPDSAEASFGATAPSAAFVISSRGIRDAEGSNPAAPTS
jgi:RecA/RadA recombinase